MGYETFREENEVLQRKIEELELKLAAANASVLESRNDLEQ